VSFISDDHFAELRNLFFESAAELVESLNEDGISLEKNVNDGELRQRVRRTVHTLKGDAAAAGFAELSELAHELEDVLSATTLHVSGPALANVVLQAADVFGDMLELYRKGETPLVPEALHEEIRACLMGVPEQPQTAGKAEPARSSWSEYDQLIMEEASRQGSPVLQLSLGIDPNCPSGVAAQMVRNALQSVGTLLAISPADGETSDGILRVAVATTQDAKLVCSLCRIPAVTTIVEVEQPTLPEAHSAPLSGRSTQSGGPPHAVPDQPPISTRELESGDGGEDSPAGRREAKTADPASRPGARDNIMRVDAARIDEALNLVGELIIGKSMLMQSLNEFEDRFAKDPVAAKFADAMAFQSRVLTDLQKSVMKIRMVPVDQLFRRFPRMARDLAKTCGKEFDLRMSGEDTDLDKGILDSLAEPLSHLIRNAIDHGLETPDERIAAGKPRTGTISLSAYHQGNHIVIECSDDGRGIDRDKLVGKAIDARAISVDEAAHLGDSEALALIFRPGLSTAEHVTKVSGRGVGMDIVKTVTERLKGSVHIESQVGRGTTFRLKVPLTLAIIKALMFRASERLYAVPLASVLEIARAYSSDVHRVDQHEVLQLRDEVLTLVRLDKLHHGAAPRPAKFFVVVISYGERKFGLIVDKLVGEEEMVIKALDDHLVATPYVSGASILGDGSVVLILNIQALGSTLGRVSARPMEVSA
jgi:two-component system chemotaxis sensor kinase CheA